MDANTKKPPATTKAPFSKPPIAKAAPIAKPPATKPLHNDLADNIPKKLVPEVTYEKPPDLFPAYDKMPIPPQFRVQEVQLARRAARIKNRLRSSPYFLLLNNRVKDIERFSDRLHPQVNSSLLAIPSIALAKDQKLFPRELVARTRAVKKAVYNTVNVDVLAAAEEDGEEDGERKPKKEGEEGEEGEGEGEEEEADESDEGDYAIHADVDDDDDDMGDGSGPSDGGEGIL